MKDRSLDGPIAPTTLWEKLFYFVGVVVCVGMLIARYGMVA
jgi:hypothetical protein